LEEAMKRVTAADLYDKKAKGEKITMLTAYDYPLATIVDRAGVDTVLVGDSLGMVVLGYESTVPVTLEEMIHHTTAARRGISRALLIGDMPFLAYHVSDEQAVENCGRLFKESGCEMVKLEGGVEMADRVKKIVDMGIPVCGHIGLTPQTSIKLGGFRVQGKDVSGAQYQYDSAKALDQAGAQLLVLECVPSPLAKLITETVSMPTIGIGAGPDCDGQVLVTNDMLGLFDRFQPKFVKKYIDLMPEMDKAVKAYMKEVECKKFPAPEHEFKMDESLLAEIKR